MSQPRSFRRISFGLFAALLAPMLLPRPLAAVELVSGIDDPALLSASANGTSERPTYFAVDATGRWVAFQSTAANLAPGDVNKIDDIFVRDMLLGTTVCASTDSGGTVGNGVSSNGAVSRDGRFVAYESMANNLVAGDTNATRDIFVKDLQNGATTRVSTSGSGVQAGSSSSKPALSADGRYVAFESYATNLVVPDGNTSQDIFVKDLQTGAITRASTSSIGGTANNNSSAPSISADGRYVVFNSYASNLVAGDTNGTWDVFRKDLQTGELLRVSTDAGGVQANGRSDMATISADGRYVSFASYSTNLVADDTNGQCDVFVKDLQDGLTSRVSTDGSGAQANGYSYNYGISDDGRYVVLQTAATNLIADETAPGVIRKDLQTGAAVRVNTSGDGTLAANTDYPAIGGDGRFVAMRSRTAMVADDGNGVADTYLKDLQTGAVSLVSVRDPAVSGFFAASGDSGRGFASMSADGRFVAFTSLAPNLVAGDTNGCSDPYLFCGDVFVRDMETGITGRVSTDSGGAQANGSSQNPSLSGDGRLVVFDSSAANLVPGDTNQSSDVFLKDLSTGATTRVSTKGDGAQVPSGSYNPLISADGRFVAFRSYAGDLDGGVRDTLAHIFVKDLQTGVVLRASAAANGAVANDGSGYASISADGRYVAFYSWSTNLVPGDTNNTGDVFVKDLQTGAILRASTDSAGAEADDSSGGPAISGDGRLVAFFSRAGNLVPGGTAGAAAAYVKDLQTGVTTLVGAIGSGADSSGLYNGPAISGGGSYVVFVSSLANLVSGDTNGMADVFMKNMQTGALSRVNVDDAGGQARWNSGDPAISADGRHVTFTTSAENLVVGDGNSAFDVYRVFVPHPNVAPHFAKGADQHAFAGAGVQTVAGWATGIGPGTPEEAGQTLEFLVANDADGLFSLQPAIAPDGTLTYAPAAGATGSATVTVWLLDDGGTADGGVDTSVSQAFTITVTADVTPPAGSILINNGAASTITTAVTLKLAAADTGGSGVASMRFRNRDTDPYGAWEPYQTSKAWTLPNELGTRKVYVQFMDRAGNVSDANPAAAGAQGYVDGITLRDGIAPSGSIRINNGAASTSTAAVTLKLTATDLGGSGLGTMRFRNSTAEPYSAWEPYQVSKPWTLIAGAGTRKVYAQFRDLAGNVSDANLAAAGAQGYLDSIALNP